MDIELLKEIPGYKAILKAVLKSQIQMLVEQLSAQTEEESVLLTVSLTDGSLHHLGSMSGKDFLEGREEIKSQFLFHCLNRKTRSPVPNQDQVFMPHLSSPMPRVTSPLQHVTSPSAIGQYSPESRPAKKPRRTLPLPTGRGRGRKPQSQINAGARNIPRPRVSAPATITRPPEEPDTTGYTAGETEKAPEPDLITVKAEDFELNIDLNDSATKPNEAPVDNVISDIMNIVNQPLKSVPVPANSTQSFASDQGDLDMSASTGDVKDSNTSLSGMEGDSSLNLKESIMPVKIEAPDDDLEITGSEPGAAQAMYMVAGSSGTMGSQSWAPMGTVGMESESFTSGAEGQDEESFDYGNQTSGRIYINNNTGQFRIAFSHPTSTPKSTYIPKAKPTGRPRGRPPSTPSRGRPPSTPSRGRPPSTSSRGRPPSTPSRGRPPSKPSRGNSKSASRGARSTSGPKIKINSPRTKSGFSPRIQPGFSPRAQSGSSPRAQSGSSPRAYSKGKKGKARTRAEIQRAYRDRKKARLGDEYYEIEKSRIRKYYKKASELPPTKLEERRIKSRITMRKYRERLKLMQLAEFVDIKNETI